MSCVLSLRNVMSHMNDINPVKLEIRVCRPSSVLTRKTVLLGSRLGNDFFSKKHRIMMH